MSQPPAPPPPAPLRPGWQTFLIQLLASGLGGGLSPFAPGTAGTATAVAFYWLVMREWNWPTALAFTGGFTALAVWIASLAEPIYGKRDSGRITIDEWAGFFTTMIPFTGVYDRPWIAAGVGFFLFRALDVLKPWPCRTIDRLKNGGMSVVMDDVVAGFYGAGLMAGLSALGWIR